MSKETKFPATNQAGVSKSLVELLDSPSYPVASCTFTNELPARWEVDIVEIACKFIYDDGHNDDKGKVVTIKSGQQDTVIASYTGCCRSYVTLTKAKATDGTGETWVIPNAGSVDAEYCGGELTVRLVPKKKTAKHGSGPQLPFEIVIDQG